MTLRTHPFDGRSLSAKLEPLNSGHPKTKQILNPVLEGEITMPQCIFHILTCYHAFLDTTVGGSRDRVEKKTQSLGSEQWRRSVVSGGVF